MRRFAATAVALLGMFGVLFSAAAANADTVYAWTMSGGGNGGVSGKGTLTVSSTAVNTAIGTGYLATGMTGTFSSKDFTSDVTGLFGPNFAVNNVIYYPKVIYYPPYNIIVDDFGLGFQLFNSYQMEIGWNNGTYTYNITCCGSGNPVYSYPQVIFSLGAPVPEPPTWLMMMAGVTAIGALAARKSWQG